MDPDVLATACHILEKDWGSYGYRVESIAAGWGDGALLVAHADGSRFALAVCRYGCHYADREHDGTTAGSTAAAINAIGAARARHNAQDADRYHLPASMPVLAADRKD